ncbi:MAG: GTP-binding protein [Rhodospirillales bacterium 70-18]|nr:GTP-binding protein [Rhodospirillales bacterium]OJY74635.1 MAG: GTP-binding protein [Rhodospirillales bacterium 70-18]
MADPVAVTLLTGFLGAGKTTLLNALLKRTEMAGTAVLVNEFGEIGLDHLLVDAIRDESPDTVLLPSGCLCCAVRGDLVRALRDLVPRVLAGEVRRVVVETTGLADPAPVIQSLMGDLSIVRHFRLDGLVTVVDAVHAAATLDAHEAARRQVAMADRIVMTKTDLAPGTLPLIAKIRLLNPAAPILEAVRGALDPEKILDCGLFDPSGKLSDVQNWLDSAAFGGDSTRHQGIESFCLTYDQPLHWQGVGTCLEMLIGTRGESLLRVKGILNLVGQDRPVAIHGVQHMFHEPVLLPAWPAGDPRTSRIVFITIGLDRATIEQGLAAFEAAAANI